MRVLSAISDLPFHYPFTISKGSKTAQPSLLVALEGPSLAVGYGEAPAISYYNVTVESMLADLRAKRVLVEKFAFTDPERYWHYLHHLIPGNPFLVCALDMAGWDLYGRSRGRSLSSLWGLDPAAAPVSDYTIGLDSLENMVSKLVDNPWPVYKIKLGVAAPGAQNGPGITALDDLDIVRALRGQTSAPLRVDANGAWTVSEALAKIPVLADLGVELVEQPLAADDWAGMKQLFAVSPIPLIADESCVREADVDRCVGYFHGINIKLTKCGGITPARRMISRGRELGLLIMGGSMNETSIGTAALAALGPLFDFADMDGPLLLNGDVATGLTYVDGRATPSGEPGLGIKISEGLIFIRE